MNPKGERTCGSFTFSQYKDKDMTSIYGKLVKAMPELRHDPFVRGMLAREERENESRLMHTMNQMPSRSGYVVFLQNRILLRSVGNARFSKRMYYDVNSHMIGEDPCDCNIPFRSAMLKNGQPAAGWIYEDGRT